MSATELTIVVLETPVAIFAAYVVFRMIAASVLQPPGYSPAERHPWIVPAALGTFFFAATDLLNYRNGGYDPDYGWISYLLLAASLLFLLLLVKLWRDYRAEA